MTRGNNTYSPGRFASHAVSVYAPFSPWQTTNGTSADVPWKTVEYDTEGSMSDVSVAVSGTATGTQSATTLQDTSQAWSVNQYAGAFVKLLTNAGNGEWRLIISNTSNTLTISTGSTNWNTTPVTASTTYEITENSHKLVAPEDGIYELKAHCSIAYQATVLGIFFYINGGFAGLHYERQGSQTVELNNGYTRNFEMAAGDYATVRIYNGNTSFRQIFGGSARFWFQMTRIGDN